MGRDLGDDFTVMGVDGEGDANNLAVPAWDLKAIGRSALVGCSRDDGAFMGPSGVPYSSGEPHLPFQVKPLSSVLMDDLKVAHKYGG